MTKSSSTRTASAAPPRKTAYQLKRPAVICAGGPRSGWCYYVDDIETMQTSDERMGRVFPYERTEEFEAHPVTGNSCRIWRWIPPHRRRP